MDGKENHGTVAVDVPWFLFRNIQHREGETPGEVFPSFRLRRKFTPSCAFGSTGEFRHLRMPTKGFAPGPHFLFFREDKGSEKKLKCAARLEFRKRVQIPGFPPRVGLGWSLSQFGLDRMRIPDTMPMVTYMVMMEDPP